MHIDRLLLGPVAPSLTLNVRSPLLPVNVEPKERVTDRRPNGGKDDRREAGVEISRVAAGSLQHGQGLTQQAGVSGFSRGDDGA
ncbi:hypothetical protein JCM17478_22750 [Thermopirellula anaerolimosa]